MNLLLSAAALHARHPRPLLLLLVILLLIGAGYMVFRAVEGRGSRARQHGSEGDSWSASPSPPTPNPPPAAASPAAAAPAAPSPAAPPPPATVQPAPDGSGGSGRSAAPSELGTVRPRRPGVDLAEASRGWAVETRGLTKRFGSIAAVNGVDLRVPRGCAFGYLGPNGAGKTTLIRTLLGLTKANSGTMSLLGIPVPAERDRALARVGAIVDEPRFHPHLTGQENLRLLAAARGDGAHARIEPSLARVGLTARADDKVATYSMGMRQRLGVASCLLGDPELLILDEPMNGLDPAGMHEMRTTIETLVAEGRTIMLSSHLLDEVERTCDAVAIVDRGQVVRQGPIDQLVREVSSDVVKIECSEPERAARLVSEAGLGSATASGETGLTVSLSPDGPGSSGSREIVAEITRRLVGGGISVYGLEQVRASLEEWFLSVTSRFGGQS